MDWASTYRSRVTTAEKAVECVRSGDHVWLHAGCNNPEELVRALVARADGLENVEVVRARSEDVAPSPRFDYVTARAVSALKTLLPVTGHLLGAGGEFVFLKGANAPAMHRASVPADGM